MDEVDGMSGGGILIQLILAIIIIDRGGIKAIIDAIKVTKVPIICICNDRMDPKIRSLASHCYDIRFQRPPKQMIAKRIAEIAIAEGMRVDMNSLEYLCESFGNDIRQILNFLELYSKKSKIFQYQDAKMTIGGAKKDQAVMISNFGAASKFLCRADVKSYKSYHFYLNIHS